MTENGKALLLIDLQNEFLTPEGNFPIQCAPELLGNIEALVTHFRATHPDAFIIWVRAEYPPLDGKESSLPGFQFNVLTGRHAGRKACCYAGTPGAEFPQRVEDMIRDSDVVLVKTWYSAFKETILDTLLRKRGVTELFIAGLLTHVCVMAAVTEACSLGYRVHVVESCLGTKRVESHQRALHTIRDLGVHVAANAQDLLDDHPNPPQNNPPVPSLYYVNGSIPSSRVLMALYEKV